MAKKKKKPAMKKVFKKRKVPSLGDVYAPTISPRELERLYGKVITANLGGRVDEKPGPNLKIGYIDENRDGDSCLTTFSGKRRYALPHGSNIRIHGKRGDIYIFIDESD